MKLIWTKSTLPLSVFIRWGLNTDCSHFALVFDSPAGGLMFESNLLGTHPKFFKTALKEMTIVHEIDVVIPTELEDKIWDIVVDKYDDKPYNYTAFFYFCWRAILNRTLKIPFPMKNFYNNSNGDLCVQVYQALSDGQAMPDLGLDLTVTSPHDLYLKLRETHG